MLLHLLSCAIRADAPLLAPCRVPCPNPSGLGTALPPPPANQANPLPPQRLLGSGLSPSRCGWDCPTVSDMEARRDKTCFAAATTPCPQAHTRCWLSCPGATFPLEKLSSHRRKSREVHLCEVLGGNSQKSHLCGGCRVGGWAVTATWPDAHKNLT